MKMFTKKSFLGIWSLAIAFISGIVAADPAKLQIQTTSDNKNPINFTFQFLDKGSIHTKQIPFGKNSFYTEIADKTALRNPLNAGIYSNNNQAYTVCTVVRIAGLPEDSMKVSINRKNICTIAYKQFQ